jgi:CPA2 family monovalent cation:H+ antiporter-2
LSSTALVLPISGTQTSVGRAALAMLLFEDIAIVPIIFVLGALAPRGGRRRARGLVDTLWMGALVVLAMMVVGRFALPRLFAQAARTKSPELFLAASLLVVIGASLATTAVGLSPIVGALIAGLLIAETEYHTEIEGIMEPFKGLALGVFLITVGMGVDLLMIWNNLGAIALALVGVFVIKAIVTGVLLRMMGARVGHRGRDRDPHGQPVGNDADRARRQRPSAQLVGLETAQFWTIVTALGLTVTPLLAKLGRLAARQVEPAAETIAFTFTEKDGPPAIILGCGRVGRLVAQMLTRHGKPYVALDSDSELVARCRREGYNAVFANASRMEALERLGLAVAPAVILTMDEPVLAQQITRKLRAAYPDLPIIARARDSAHAAELYRAGASTAVPETLEASLQLSEAVLVDLGVAMGPVIASIHEKRDEFRERIREGGELDHKPKLRTSVAEPG